MDEDESLKRYGLIPSSADLQEIRLLLEFQSDMERKSQGSGDTELMRLCCVQLFNAGKVDDVLLIWRAKTASPDADASIEIQLLCGSGFEETLDYLAKDPTEEGDKALKRILRCRDSGDFEGFTVQDQTSIYAEYYT